MNALEPFLHKNHPKCSTPRTDTVLVFVIYFPEALRRHLETRGMAASGWSDHADQMTSFQ